MSKQYIEQDVIAEDAAIALDELIRQQGVAPIRNLDELSISGLAMMTPTI
jgi:hypothetical protein